MFEIMPDLCRGLTGALRQGRLAIVDHVITSARIYEALLEAAAGYRLKTVRVQCSAALLKQREAARGDRFAGSAEASLRYLYPQSGYDLCVDSGKATPAEIAARLMALL